MYIIVYIYIFIEVVILFSFAHIADKHTLGSVPQGCPALSSTGVPQECHQECPTKVSGKSVLRECQVRASEKSVK